MSLYKYTSARNARFIGTCSLRFSPPGAFNDPFDCLPDLSALRMMPQYHALRVTVRNEAIQRTTSKKAAAKLEAQTWNRLIEPQLRQLYLEKLIKDRENFRVLCLTECPPTSPGAALMMGHYSDLQKGFAYEFDDRHPWFAAHRERRNPQRAIRRVVYRKTRASMSGDGRNGLFVKSTPWRYEREVRLLRAVIHGANELGGAERDIAKYPAPMLRSITLGYASNSRTLGMVRRQLKANAGLSHVKLYKLELDPFLFRFVAVSVPI